jgi:hypothetical protein
MNCLVCGGNAEVVAQLGKLEPARRRNALNQTKRAAQARAFAL